MPEKKELSKLLFRWMMPYLLLVSVSAVMMAVHNTLDRFFVPAVTPIIFSVCVIAALYLGAPVWGAVSIGIGVMAGGIAQIIVQLPTYRKLGYRLLPSFNFRSQAFSRVMKKWAPILITSSLFAVNNQIAMLLASKLPDKSVSSLANAIVFFQLPFGIFSASITTVLYPKMSRQAALGNQNELLGSLGFGYRNIWALLLPSAVAMILLGEPIVAIAFQRGAFTVEDTVMTARVLAAYCVGMPFLGLFNITQRAFYAIGNVKTPFYCSLAIVLVDIVLSVVSVFFTDGGSENLAWANSIAFIIGAFYQYLAFRKITGFSLKSEFMPTFWRVCAATAAGALIMVASKLILGNSWWNKGSSWSALVILIAVSILAAAVILGLYGWMNVEAVSIILKRGAGKGDEKT